MTTKTAQFKLMSRDMFAEYWTCDPDTQGFTLEFKYENGRWYRGNFGQWLAFKYIGVTVHFDGWRQIALAEGVTEFQYEVKKRV